MGGHADKHIFTNYLTYRFNRHALMAKMDTVRIDRNCHINAIVNE